MSPKFITPDQMARIYFARMRAHALPEVSAKRYGITPGSPTQVYWSEVYWRLEQMFPKIGAPKV